jgi:hypothetical protein
MYIGCSRRWKTAKKRCVDESFSHGNAYLCHHPMYLGSYVIYASTDPNEKPPADIIYERHCTITTPEEEV